MIDGSLHSHMTALLLGVDHASLSIRRGDSQTYKTCDVPETDHFGHEQLVVIRSIFVRKGFLRELDMFNGGHYRNYFAPSFPRTGIADPTHRTHGRRVGSPPDSTASPRRNS